MILYQFDDGGRLGVRVSLAVRRERRSHPFEIDIVGLTPHWDRGTARCVATLDWPNACAQPWTSRAMRVPLPLRFGVLVAVAHLRRDHDGRRRADFKISRLHDRSKLPRLRCAH